MIVGLRIGNEFIVTPLMFDLGLSLGGAQLNGSYETPAGRCLVPARDRNTAARVCEDHPS